MRRILLILCGSLLSIHFVYGQTRIIFLGDSITESGVHPDGYVNLVADSLMILDDSLTVMGAGISGNKVPDLLARLDEDVLAYQPTHVVIYIGINDVWHHYEFDHVTGTDPGTFEEGLIELIDHIEESSATVLLCTPSVIGEDVDSKEDVNVRLQEYAQITRKVADNKNVHLCDLRESLEAYLLKHNTNRDAEGILTTDGVHLNEEGNRFVAHFMIQQLRFVLGL
ncbi:MAG: SGNH/GDSL hydrolase family protein [Bacteroidetes bacterium]|nr:SGNH/GDSL hydrolase family protein [Bacteroidota bacterium]MCY4223760.1 SGNH/GDSL hydrolase family protein [Bacteroidota bacterium]